MTSASGLFVEYEPGSWGPPASDQFIAADGRQWVQICGEHCHDSGSAEHED